MVLNDSFERRDSGKRRRLSERRRAFSRLSGRAGQMQKLLSTGSSASQSWSSSSQMFTDQDQSSAGMSRSESPLGEKNAKVSMKIQFHIRVAPDNEPLIVEPNCWSQNISAVASAAIVAAAAAAVAPPTRATMSTSSSKTVTTATTTTIDAIRKGQSVESMDSTVHERLSRQNTASTKRRQQLLAMHNQSIKSNSNSNSNSNQTNDANQRIEVTHGSVQSEDNITVLVKHQDSTSGQKLETSAQNDETTTTIATTATKESKTRDDDDLAPLVGRCEQGARSSTITSGMSDEATMRFLARHQGLSQHRAAVAMKSPLTGSLSTRTSTIPSEPEREHIYFKRDGQRFGHEFTLKLAVDRTYRCLLKVRPLVPLQSISIQGHHITFVDCTVRNYENPRLFDASSSLMSSAPSLSRSWQNINSSRHNLTGLDQQANNNYNNTKQHRRNNQPTRAQQSPNQLASPNFRLNHAQTLANVSRAGNSAYSVANPTAYQISQAGSKTIDHSTIKHLREQQQNQMLRSFAASNRSSSSNSHLGSQLNYMFDWSVGHFEVNKNKVRTEVQTLLKFKNGQMLTLPLQVKFYQSESRQHLNWGSQLHFIDFDCSADNFGNVNVDRVQYY